MFLASRNYKGESRPWSERLNAVLGQFYLVLFGKSVSFFSPSFFSLRMALMSQYNPMDLSGRHILVTGASAGIGRATAGILARLGARLALNARNVERLTETLNHLEPSANGEPHVLAPFDLTQIDAIPGWLKEYCGRSGPLDGVAHCGGMQALRPIRAFSASFFDEIARTNLGSVLALARGFRQRGCHGPGSAMAFVSSTAGLKGSPGNIVYSTTKAGVIAATKGLAIELLGDGIRVNCVAPAIVDTELIERVRATLTKEQYDGLIALQPLGIGSPDDVGHAIAYLLAEKTGRWVTGTTIAIDGGATA
ncbi:SDR family oxidoreductase [Azospirillaceae bacterium]